MSSGKLITPTEACERLGLLPTPGEKPSAKYNRRRSLGKRGLSQIPGPGYKGYRYLEHEVEADRAKLKPIKRAA